VADANVSKIGVNSAVEKETVAAAVEPAAPPAEPVAPNVSERRVVGKRVVEAYGQKIVVENL